MKYNPLTSRTVWTIIAMWLITYGPVIGTVVPQQWKPLVDGVLSVFAFYFHVDGVKQAGASRA